MDTQGFNEAISLISRVVKAGKKATNIQYEEALNIAREQLNILKSENIQLNEELTDLKKRADIEGRIIKKPSEEWIMLENDKSEASYCLYCLEKEGKLFTLQVRRDYGSQFICRNCDKEFGNYIDFPITNDINL